MIQPAFVVINPRALINSGPEALMRGGIEQHVFGQHRWQAAAVRYLLPASGRLAALCDRSDHWGYPIGCSVGRPARHPWVPEEKSELSTLLLGTGNLEAATVIKSGKRT